MAISIVGSPVTSSANNGNNATANLSTLGLQEGDLVIVSSCSPRVTGTAPTETSGLYTAAITPHIGGASAGPTVGIWYKFQGSTPDSSVTVSGDGSSATDTTIVAVALRGVDTSTPLDATPTTAGETVSGNPDPPAITTNTDGAWVVVLGTAAPTSDTSITAPSGYSNHAAVSGSDSYDHTHATATKLISSHGTENPPSWTNWTTSFWYAVTMAIKPITTVTTSKTITGKARMQKTTSKTINGKGRIGLITSKTVQGISNIQLQTQKTIDGKARIGLITPKTITGISRITVNTSKTIEGKGRIGLITPKTIQGQSRVTISTSKTIQGQSRIELATEKTVQGKSRIEVTTSKTIQGKGYISAATGPWYDLDWGYRVKITIDKDAITSADPQHGTYATGFGFGEYSNVRYRGQVFEVDCDGQITSIGFDRNKGSYGVKIYFDTVGSNNLPEHAIGSELYSFTITNANITNGYGEYNLPVALDVTAGTKYCWYLAPWDTSGDTYHDDYQDCHGANYVSAYGGNIKEITNTNGSWSTENLTHHYRVYISNKVYPNLDIFVDLADLPSGFHTNVNQTDARDIRVTTDDMETEVPREIVSYDADTDTGEIHFKGAVSIDTDTDFYIYYGNASASDYAVDATYGRNNVWTNYYVVTHAKDATSSTVTDSTGRTSGVKSGSDTPIETSTSAVGLEAQSFTGAYHIYFSDSQPTEETIMCWVKLSSTSSQYVAGRRYTGNYNQNWDLLYFTPSYWIAFSHAPGGQEVYGPAPTTNWTHLALVIRENHYLYLYVNGASQGTPVTTTTRSSGSDIWEMNTTNHPFPGLMDEFRVGKTKFSASWMATIYANQSDTSTFYLPGSEEEYGGGGGTTTSKTIDGKSRIEIVTAKTIQGKSRIAITSTKTIDGLSRITAIGSDTISGQSRITASGDKTIQGRSRITAIGTDTIDGLSRITASGEKTIQGLSRITVPTEETIQGKSRIEITSSTGIPGKSRIEVSTTKTLQGKSRLEVSTQKTLQGMSHILVTGSTSKTILGKSRIALITKKAIQGLSRIETTADKTISGIAKIQYITDKDITGKARITKISSKNILGLSRITVVTDKTVLGKARIEISTEKTITGISNVLLIESTYLQGVSRIEITTTKTILGLANIIQPSTQKDITGIASIAIISSKTIKGKASISSNQVPTPPSIILVEGHLAYRISDLFYVEL